MRSDKKKSRGSAGRVMAIAAHPDDIEFMMAGTMLLLKQAGYELHYMNLSSGNCGSMTMSPSKTIRVRKAEAMYAAKILGATFHPSLAHDLEITYDLRLLRRLAAVIRKVQPTIVLTHSPQDYMEDHTNTCRLAVTAAFARGMPNFRTIPAEKAIDSETTLYHAMPHGLRDQLRQPIIPDFFVNTESVHARKREALAAHKSQKEWLDATQGMDSYLKVMDAMSLEVGRLSRKFHHAEGWRRHLHWGFCEEKANPIEDALPLEFQR
jgi:LmbE family N-acetylglucosaminyl deacetylase